MKTALIIDDSAIMRQTLKDALECSRFATVQVYNAVDAFAVLGEAPVDLIVLDLMMPGMSGLDFLKELREHPNGGHVHVLIVSGRDDIVARQTAARWGVSGYFVKSQSVSSELLARINSVVGHPKPAYITPPH